MKTHKTLNACDQILRRQQHKSLVMSNDRARDGQKWVCVCGREFVHVCDESEGCYWIPVEQGEADGD